MSIKPRNLVAGTHGHTICYWVLSPLLHAEDVPHDDSPNQSSKVWETQRGFGFLRESRDKHIAPVNAVRICVPLGNRIEHPAVRKAWWLPGFFSIPDFWAPIFNGQDLWDMMSDASICELTNLFCSLQEMNAWFLLEHFFCISCPPHYLDQDWKFSLLYICLHKI